MRVTRARNFLVWGSAFELTPGQNNISSLSPKTGSLICYRLYQSCVSIIRKWEKYSIVSNTFSNSIWYNKILKNCLIIIFGSTFIKTDLTKMLANVCTCYFSHPLTLMHSIFLCIWNTFRYGITWIQRQFRVI